MPGYPPPGYVMKIARAPEWIAAIVVLGALILWRSWYVGLAATVGAMAPGIASEKAEVRGQAFGEITVNGLLVAALIVGLWILVKRTPGWWAGTNRGLALAIGLSFIGFMGVPTVAILNPIPYRATNAEMRENVAKELQDQRDHPENYHWVRDPETGGEMLEHK